MSSIELYVQSKFNLHFVVRTVYRKKFEHVLLLKISSFTTVSSFVLFMENLSRNKRQCVIIICEPDRFVAFRAHCQPNSQMLTSTLKKHTNIHVESLDLALNRFPLLSHFSIFVVRAACFTNSFPGFNCIFLCIFEWVFKQFMANGSVNGTQTLYISACKCPSKKGFARNIRSVGDSDWFHAVFMSEIQLREQMLTELF